MNCTNSDRSDDFFTSEKHDEHLNNHKSWISVLPVKKIVWAFFAFVVWRLPKVNEGECQQCLLVAYNCRIMTSRFKTRSHLLL